ncbi:MAG: hypothetical protein M3275_00695 [Thermoproteota archaeon]|nr:hypothetical protein [Thermoproteota archaeon]MDQ3966895.1 hypothetical protein [Thermoproteota archaeon]
MIIKLTVADAVVIVSFLVIIVVAAVPATTMHISHAQFGQPQQPQQEQEQQEQKSHLELQLEALQILKNSPNLTPAQENQIEFLEKEIEAQQQLRREHPQIFGSSPSAAPTNTNTTTITMDAEEVKAVKMAVHESMVQAKEYTEQANIAMQNNDTQAVFGNLTLIENELDNIRWNMTDIKLPTSTDRIG